MASPLANPRAAIVVGHYPEPGQTFVNRHIRHLFDGRTCVIANTCSGHPDGKPVFDRQAFRAPLSHRVAAPLAKVRLAMTHGTGNVPFGAERAAIERFLRQQNVTHILSEFGTKAVLIADIAQRLDLPAFTYLRGSDASHELTKPRRRKGYARTLPRLDGIVSVSQFLLDNLAAHGLSHPNAHVIPSGVDTRRFAPATKKPRSFLAVGRLIPKKAIGITIRAFADATADTPDARLRIIGDGPDRAAAQVLVGELKVADKIRFDGDRPHDAVRDALSTAQVFLQHSVTGPDGNTEGQPTAIQEALSSGCIVIATRHAGIPDIVDHGVNGWLCLEHDLAGYTALIRRALTTDTAPMARAARACAEKRLDNGNLLAQLERVLKGQMP